MNYATGSGNLTINTPIAGATTALTLGGTGTTLLGASNNIGLLTVNSGTLDLNGIAQSVAGFQGFGTITSNVAGVTSFTTTGGAATFSGQLNDGGAGKVVALRVTGGNQTLSGTNNSFSGGINHRHRRHVDTHRNFGRSRRRQLLPGSGPNSVSPFNMVMNGGTLNFNGGSAGYTLNVDRGIFLGSGGGTFSVGLAAKRGRWKSGY